MTGATVPAVACSSSDTPLPSGSCATPNGNPPPPAVQNTPASPYASDHTAATGPTHRGHQARSHPRRRPARPGGPAGGPAGGADGGADGPPDDPPDDPADGLADGPQAGPADGPPDGPADGPRDGSAGGEGRGRCSCPVV